MRRNYYQDLRSIIFFDQYTRLRTFLLVTILLLTFVLFHVALNTLKGETNTTNPSSPHESLRKAGASVNSQVGQNCKHLNGPVNDSDNNYCIIWETKTKFLESKQPERQSCANVEIASRVKRDTGNVIEQSFQSLLP
ncbi:hypothetical protein AHF37_05000 [Paragonimus kellicotti]|nr:hypothetical protein AHF37_05000 [Paragonimus kellicotti]